MEGIRPGVDVMIAKFWKCAMRANEEIELVADRILSELSDRELARVVDFCSMKHDCHQAARRPNFSDRFI